MKGGTAANNNGPQSDEIFSSSDETETIELIRYL